MGAADYLVEPVSTAELSAPARAALLRWLEPFAGKRSAFCDVGWLPIDYPQRRVRVAGGPVEVTATEYAAFYELAVDAPRALSYSVRGGRTDWESAGGATAGVTKGMPSQVLRVKCLKRAWPVSSTIRRGETPNIRAVERLVLLPVAYYYPSFENGVRGSLAPTFSPIAVEVASWIRVGCARS